MALEQKLIYSFHADNRDSMENLSPSVVYYVMIVMERGGGRDPGDVSVGPVYGRDYMNESDTVIVPK